MIIDFHTHIFPPSVISERDKHLDDKNFALLYSDAQSKLIDHTSLIKAMDASGIDAAVALSFPWVKEKYCVLQNEYFRDILPETGKRIFPFGAVPLGNTSSIDSHVREIKEMGLFGIGEVGFYSSGFSQKEEGRLSMLFESAQRHGLPVCLHVSEPIGHDYAGKHRMDLGRLYSVIREFPGVTVILAHWGGGILFYELMPEAGEAFANVFYDTAASPFLYKNDIYDAAVKIVGPGKILFGSDYPLIRFERYTEAIKNAGIGKDAAALILGGNAKRLLGIK
jgi:uncharacterized protein